MRVIKFSNPTERLAWEILQQIVNNEELCKELGSLLALIQDSTVQYNFIDVEMVCIKIVGKFANMLINLVVYQISVSEKREKNYIIGKDGIKKDSVEREQEKL